MNRHLLLALSGDDDTAPIRFISSFLQQKEKITLTLLYVTLPKQQGFAQEQLHLQQARDELVRAGFAPAQIECKTIPKQYGLSRDIIREAQAELYDAVVTGKRTRTILEQIYDASVAQQLLKDVFSFPLWICHQPDASSQGILVCVDGSDASLRMVDHVSFIAAPEAHPIVLCYVGDATQSTSDIFATARLLLEENGVGSSRIEEHVLPAGNPFESIVQFALERGIAVIATGRRAVLPEGFFQKLWDSSVSEQMRANVAGFTYWVSK